MHVLYGSNAQILLYCTVLTEVRFNIDLDIVRYCTVLYVRRFSPNFCSTTDFRGELVNTNASGGQLGRLFFKSLIAVMMMMTTAVLFRAADFGSCPSGLLSHGLRVFVGVCELKVQNLTR